MKMAYILVTSTNIICSLEAKLNDVKGGEVCYWDFQNTPRVHKLFFRWIPDITEYVPTIVHFNNGNQMEADSILNRLLILVIVQHI